VNITPKFHSNSISIICNNGWTNLLFALVSEACTDLLFLNIRDGEHSLVLFRSYHSHSEISFYKNIFFVRFLFMTE